MLIPGTNLQGFTIKELPPVANPEAELVGAYHEVETPTGQGGAPENKGLTTEQWVAFLANRIGGNTSPNRSKSLLKAYRYLTRAEIAANGGFGEALEDLDYSTAAIGTQIRVEFYNPPGGQSTYGQLLVAVYDSAAPANHYVYVDGSFRAGDTTPAKFVPVGSDEARYGYVRRDTDPASIADWQIGELSIWSINGSDQFATVKQAGGPFPAFTGVEDGYWKPAAAPVMGASPGGTAETFVATESVGGIQAGQSVTSTDPAMKRLLVTYQVPGFSSFTIAGQGSQTVKVGTPYPAGFKSFAWATANSANIRPNSLTIRDVTANTILGSNEANDGTASFSTAGFTVTLGQARVYLISGVDTKGNTFFRDVTISGLFESFFGYTDANGPLDMATLLSLGNAVLQNGKARTVSGVTAGPGLYTVYAWPSDGKDDIAQILQDGVDSIRGAFGIVRYVTGQNSLGATVTMGYIISNATRAFTNSSLAFL